MDTSQLAAAPLPPRAPAQPAAPRLTRRRLLQQTAGLAAVGVLGTACQQAPAATGTPAGGAAAPTSGAASPGATSPAPGAASALVLSPRRSFKVVWTALTGSQAAIWMAYETGAWRELGLDVELIRIPSSSRLASAMQANEVDGGSLDWALAFQFVSQNGNAKQVGAITNRQIFSVLSVPSITRPQDVVGKRWGITRLGSSTHTASLLALELWGLRPDDVQFLQVQEVPAILAGMEAGQIDVGTVSPPTSIQARKSGFRELIDLAEQGPDYPSIGLAVVDRHITESPELVRTYLAGYAAGVARFRKDSERAVAVMRQYLRLEDDELLKQLYQAATHYIAFPPVVPMAALPRVKEDVTRDDPRVANVRIEDVAAPQFADELQAQGYFASLL
ncbi:MAG TPA: ABC transporter substrate-binding protein [Chloroflexota bacterium]|jgi:ABC-type nitrate/sulfonate/bicarbonate transport system substrate-binding protein|nr:ABC transporter substrate-binding protein [Chloroflexota bacterium]